MATSALRSSSSASSTPGRPAATPRLALIGMVRPLRPNGWCRVSSTRPATAAAASASTTRSSSTANSSLAVVGVDQGEQVAVDQLARVVAEHPPDRLAVVADGPSASTMLITSEEFWTSDRKRSSLAPRTRSAALRSSTSAVRAA
jgi:hypothetical protein